MSSRPSDPSGSLAVVGGTVIDGNGGKPIQDGVILIDGKRIVAVGQKGMELPRGCRQLDATGQFVIPGLMDANVHLVIDFFPLTLVRFEGRYDELAIEAAQVALRSGVTTVFDSWGPREYLIKARDAINAGEAEGARIFCAGNIVGLGGPFSDDFFPQARETLLEDFTQRTNAIWEENVGADLMWMSPEQVREEIRSYAQRGIDFMKYAVTGHGIKTAHYIQFSPRVQRVILEEAHRAGLIVQTHTTSGEGLRMAVDAGVDMMQHADVTFGPYPIPAETVSLIAQRGIPCAFLPNTARALEFYRKRAAAMPVLKRYDVTDVNERALLKAGATVLLSTDGGVFSANTLNSSSWKEWNPPDDNLLLFGEGHFHWLTAMEEKGMSPMAALMAATRNIARAYKVDEDVGTLEKGKLADLLILEKNPLDAAAHYRTLTTVLKEGKVIDRDSLPTRHRLTPERQTSTPDVQQIV